MESQYFFFELFALPLLVGNSFVQLSYFLLFLSVEVLFLSDVGEKSVVDISLAGLQLVSGCAQPLNLSIEFVEFRLLLFSQDGDRRFRLHSNFL